MITVAIALLVLGGFCFLVRAIGGPSLADRIIAVDGLIATLVAAILLTSIQSDTDVYIGVALMVGFVGFVGTIAGARFIERRGG
jgi:multicomponent Na+:H+ antiporter subunit F